MKINFSNVVIEVTRKCNMKCRHCLRGNAQNIEISDIDLDTFFSKVGYISDLTISGGEPSIAAHKINTVVDMLEKYNVGVGNFYIATNAKEVSNEFLLAVMRLYCHCDDNEISALNYSNDAYHDKMKMENIKKLEVFKFTSARNRSEYENNNVLNEGRAKTNGIGNHGVKHDLSYFLGDISEYVDTSQDNAIIDNMTIYLNCKGNVICGCDWSYKNQDKKENIICNVNDMNIESFVTYIKRFEKSC